MRLFQATSVSGDLSSSVGVIQSGSARSWPFVTLVLKRTVAKVLSIRRAQVYPMLGRVLVELQQHVGVVDDLGHRLGVLGAVVDLEGLDRDLGLVDISAL